MSKVNKVAILIDGGFYTQRFKILNKKLPVKSDIERLVKDLITMINEKSGADSDDILLRTYYYDCLPFNKTVKDLSGKNLDFSQSSIFKLQTKFINSLKDIDQFALRLGELSFSGWKLNAEKPDEKAVPDFRQKGVDMKIGLDMAWMAGKSTVDKIILVAGDSDFVSPIKLVRREGILVYLYPMGNNLKIELVEHSDFILKSTK